MRVSKTDRAERKITTEVDKKLRIINYDFDNLYPDYCRSAVASSTTAKRAVLYLKKFLRGAGFRDEIFAKLIVNRKKQTTNHVLNAVADDYAHHNGYALHYNFDLNGAIAEVHHVPFRFVRMCCDELFEYDPTKYACYDDWAGVKRPGKRISKEVVTYYHAYNPDPAVVKAQIEEAGGIANYRGQLLWFSAEGPGVYPLAPYDSALNDIETDAGTQTYRKRNVKNGFLSFNIVTTPEMETADSEEFDKDLENFQGAENSHRIMHLELKNEQEKTLFDVKSIPMQADVPKLFDSVTRTAKDGIIESFGIPPIVMGVRVPGELGGDTKQRRDAYKSYNADTVEERSVISMTFKEFGERWNKKPVNGTNDWTIIPLQLETPGEQVSLAELLGDNLEAAMEIVKSNLPTFQKEKILVEIFGVPADSAKIIVDDGTAGTASDKKSLAEKIGVSGVTAWTGIISNPTLSDEKKIANIMQLFDRTEEQARTAVLGIQTNPPA
jgi:hypothetical protein